MRGMMLYWVGSRTTATGPEAIRPTGELGDVCACLFGWLVLPPSLCHCYCILHVNSLQTEAFILSRSCFPGEAVTYIYVIVAVSLGLNSLPKYLMFRYSCSRDDKGRLKLCWLLVLSRWVARYGQEL